MQGRIWIGWEGERLSEQMTMYAGNGTLLTTDTFFFSIHWKSFHYTRGDK